MSGKLERLNELIDIELDSCSKEDWPYVCNIASTPEGKKSIKAKVIEQCKVSGITVGQALARIERAFNANKIED